MDSEYSLQFLEEIDASACEVTDWEATFLASLLQERPRWLSERQQAVIRRMAHRSLQAEVE